MGECNTILSGERTKAHWDKGPLDKSPLDKSPLLILVGRTKAHCSQRNVGKSHFYQF